MPRSIGSMKPTAPHTALFRPDSVARGGIGLSTEGSSRLNHNFILPYPRFGRLVRGLHPHHEKKVCQSLFSPIRHQPFQIAATIGYAENADSVADHHVEDHRPSPNRQAPQPFAQVVARTAAIGEAV